MTALTLANQLPAPTMEIVPAAAVEARDKLLTDATAVAITDAVTAQAASGFLVGLHELIKSAEAQRKKIKAPVLQMGKAIDEVCDRFSKPIDVAKEALKAKVQTWDAKVAKERAEAQAKIDAERRRAEHLAEQERQRLQDIADAEHAATMARLKAKAEAEARELADLLGTPIEERPVVEPAKVVVEAPKPVLPTTATLMPAHAEPSVLTTRKVQKVRILSAKRVAAVFEIGLHRFVTINEREVEAALKAGASVDGAELYWEETTVMKSSRA